MGRESFDWSSRLEPSTFSALRQAGWHYDRNVDVSAVISSLEEQGYTSSPVIVQFLASIFGLKVESAREAGPNFSNDEPFLVDPAGVGARHRDEAIKIGVEIGGSWFPVGWWLSYCHVFMEHGGALAAYANGLIWSLGGTPDEGLDLMVSASRPLVCVYAPEGVPPWPK